MENISVQNRPMKIAEEYNVLTSNAWLDAKTALDDLEMDDASESFKVKLLCSILMVGW